jgi:nitronate monooxygenase
MLSTMPFDVRDLTVPIVQAPMAGGPSTPELAAAVCEAGGLGFLAAGYRTTAAVAEQIGAVRTATDRPFGVNIFAPPEEPAAPATVAAYADAIGADADRYGVTLGAPRFDDDDHAAKLELVIGARVPIVSFTFGCPRPEVVSALHGADIAVWVTVTDGAEAALAQAVGADALVAQGAEAGGHRGYFRDDRDREDLGLLALLRLLSSRTSLPLIATGGIADGAAVAAVLCAGAGAAQLGSAFMLTLEAGTSAAHRSRLAAAAPTRLTRAFSGRQARGIVNRFMDDHDGQAPRAYPEIHHLTTPLRAAARERDDAEAINLWAGQAHELAEALGAGQLVHKLAADATAALEHAASALEHAAARWRH